MLTFDRKRLMAQIEALPKQMRVGFAAACAQRQLPNYLGTTAANPTGNPEAVTRILRELWDGIARNSFQPEKIQREAAICQALIPDYEECFEGIEYAEDAVLSLAYAVDTALSGTSQDAMWAAEHAYGALNEYIIQRFGVDTNAPNAQSLIDSFPIIQAEISRQQVDLTELRAAAKHSGSEVAALTRIKLRAESDAASFFG
jgi:uncharacterized protein YjaG (DUF416 family)